MGDQLFVLGMGIAVALLLSRLLARWVRVPEAIPLVAFGVLMSLLPGTDGVQIPPDIVLNVFLPPLVYHAAFLTAPRETRQEAVPITILAFGLTCATALAVAYAAGLAVPGMTWAAALALGAAVAPTDPVAATSVLQRVGAPKRLATVLEGESLVNDGVALTLFGLALSGLASTVTAADAALELVRVVLGGILYGMAVAWVIRRIRKLVRDPGSQIVLSLATPFVAYLPAQALGFSGVLATIVVGFGLGLSSGVLQPGSRLTGQAFWQVLVFLLESTLFVLLGLEVTDVFADVAAWPWQRLALGGLLMVVVVVLVRVLWTMLVIPLVRFKWPFSRRERLVLGWAGMRGAITLAIALSIPLDVHNRPLLVFLAACVVLGTLGGQAPTLAPLLRRLGLGESQAAMLEEARAREMTLEAALAKLDELAADEQVDDRTAEVFRQLFELRLDRVREILGDDAPTEDEQPDAHGELRRALVRAQRDKLRRLYDKGEIGADTLRKLDQELLVEGRRGVAGGH